MAILDNIYLLEVTQSYTYIKETNARSILALSPVLFQPLHKSNRLSFFIFKQELDYVVEELEKIAVVNLLKTRSIISLIGNVQKSSLILEKVLCYIISL